MTDLSYPELCGLKAKASVNFSFKGGDKKIRSLDDCGVQLEKIRTLACELQLRKAKDPTSVKLSMDELLNSDELKKVYVIPLTLKNGQEVTAIVDKSGRGMALELKDEEGKSANFILSDRLKSEITKNPKEIEKMLTSDGLAKHLNLESIFVPENIDELSEGIVNKNLIPTKQEVEDKGKVKEEEYDPEKVKGKDAPENAKEAEKEEVDLEEVAKTVGTTKEALEKFIEAEGIKDKNQIKGVKALSDIEGLEALLGQKLPEQNSTVLIVKTEGTLNKDDGYIINTDGNTLLKRQDNVNNVAEELVPEHACSETIKNVKETKTTNNIQYIEYTNSNNQNMKQQLDNTNGNTQIDMVKYAQSKIEYLKMKRDSAIEELNASQCNSQSEYLTKIAEIQDTYKMELGDLQAQTGVNIQDVYGDAEKEAENTYKEAGVEEVKEDAKGVISVVGKAVATGAVIAGVAQGVKGINGKTISEKKDETKDDRDPREQHEISHDEGRIPPWMQ